MMNKLSKRISILTLLSFLSLIQACTEVGGFSSSRPSNNNSQVVRGPTGGGTGGGILVADNDGNVLRNKRFDLYINENGFTQKLKSGYTDANGRLDIDEETLYQVETGNSDLIVEVYDGNRKITAVAQIDYDS